ncbi:MAG: S8 family serine peptidase [Candidatus Delongbacteria bacterium]|nr:S8 family serine peptidase [Candidatus Delongbacteria bacterium]MBN2833659.1 S8 family serine peptidase [Candidatus Delongbacteria bacterium]
MYFLNIIIILSVLVKLINASDIKLYKAIKQINGQSIINAGYTGKNVKIGIIDAGFDGLANWEVFQNIRDNDLIKYKKNFVPDSITGLYEGQHGSWVLSYIVGKLDNYQEGLAPNAEIYIARNEFGPDDYRIEEIYLEQAIEEMYDLGVRLINISSGYTDKFDNSDEEYNPEDMNGQTSYISQVCKKFADKGVIFVVAAGNEGNWWKFWSGLISTPADVENVISVGATDFNILFNTENNGKSILKADYSGVGPEFLNYVKPDFVCYSEQGCSMSAPIITGLIATMLEIDNSLTVNQVKEILKKSSTLYPYPNNYIGYGVPDAAKVLSYMTKPEINLPESVLIEVNEDEYEFKTDSDEIFVFYKKDEHIVESQEFESSSNGKFILKRSGSSRTSVVLGKDTVYEIVWKD